MSNLKKDLDTIYSDIPIEPYPDNKAHTKKELEYLREFMIDREVDVDLHPEKEEEYGTYEKDWERQKQAIDDEIKRR